MKNLNNTAIAAIISISISFVLIILICIFSALTITNLNSKKEDVEDDKSENNNNLTDTNYYKQQLLDYGFEEDEIVYLELENDILYESDAELTLIEFAAFGCIHCKNFHNKELQIIKEDYIDKNKLNFVFKDFMIIDSTAHDAGECIKNQGGVESYIQYIDLLFTDYFVSKIKDFEPIIKELDLDFSEFKKCLDSKETQKEVDSDYNQGYDIGVKGTPSFFLGFKQEDGKFIGVYIETPDLLDMIQEFEELEVNNALVS